jgi:hypothetical protein
VAASTPATGDEPASYARIVASRALLAWPVMVPSDGAGPPGAGGVPAGSEVAPDGSGVTPRVRATRHVVWAVLLGWLVLVGLAVALAALL